MMRGVHKVGMLLSAALICGCMHSSELVKLGGINTRSDVFKVISSEDKISQGYAKLTIYANFKKEKLGNDIGNSASNTSDRTLLVNIDGQAISIKGKTREERSNDGNLRDPEAGVGIRHIFISEMEIKAGSHHIIIAIPEDNVAIEREITFFDGTVNDMLLEPVYWGTTIWKPGQGIYGSTSFLAGIRGFIIKLNGITI